MQKTEMKQKKSKLLRGGLILAVVGVMAFSMTACGGNDSKNTNSKNKTTISSEQNKYSSDSGTKKDASKSSGKSKSKKPGVDRQQKKERSDNTNSRKSSTGGTAAQKNGKGSGNGAK